MAQIIVTDEIRRAIQDRLDRTRGSRERLELQSLLNAQTVEETQLTDLRVSIAPTTIQEPAGLVPPPPGATPTAPTTAQPDVTAFGGGLTASELETSATTDPVAEKINKLAQFRQQLESGQLSVRDFLSGARPLAERINRDLFEISGTGSSGADLARSLLGQFQQTSGFKQGSADPRQLDVALPAKFERQVREELLPPGLSPEERERLLADIPQDIGFDEERFQAEREAVRQQVQSEQAATEAGTLREERLIGLEELLSTQRGRAREEAIPQLTERLQTQGLLQTGELERAFAREESRLQGASQDILTEARLTERDIQAGEIQQRLAARQGFQTAGLQREFGLQDFGRQQQTAFQLAALAQPQARGKGRGQRALGIASAIGAIGGAAGGTRTAITG